MINIGSLFIADLGEDAEIIQFLYTYILGNSRLEKLEINKIYYSYDILKTYLDLILK